ncbi:MAG TPA: DUF748 domain-containing protein [Burkholderiaceae bacterium]|nr:DUF748 domain-containing protein [Burkholderiaceae bacterium]
MTRTRRRLVIGASLLLALALLVFIALQIAVRQLRTQIEAALGPRASIGAIEAGWSGLAVIDLRIKAAAGWPADDELRARRVHVQPDLRSLFGGPWRIATIRVEDGYVSALRTRAGKTRILPALLEEEPHRRNAPAAGEPPGARAMPLVEIGRVELDSTRLDFFDASVRQPALKLSVEQLDAQVEHLALPALDQPIELQLAGIFKGVHHDGRVSIAGRYTPATHDADLKLRFGSVDLVALQPYLLKVAETGVHRGTLDLDMRATVQRNRLRAPGTLVLADLELATDGALATFAGVPRKAVLAAMTDKGKLEVKFTLDGRLDDPSFSLNENLATKIASGLAESLGVSLSGVVKGLGNVVKGLFGR